MEFDVTEGLENAPQAYERLMTGDKIGKVLVQVAALPTPSTAGAGSS